MNWGLLISLLGLSILTYFGAIAVDFFEGWLGREGVARILAKHESGMTVGELIAWKNENFLQDVDLYPHIPSNTRVCTHLLEQLRTRGAVEAIGDDGERRYILNVHVAT